MDWGLPMMEAGTCDGGGAGGSEARGLGGSIPSRWLYAAWFLTRELALLKTFPQPVCVLVLCLFCTDWVKDGQQLGGEPLGGVTRSCLPGGWRASSRLRQASPTWLCLPPPTPKIIFFAFALSVVWHVRTTQNDVCLIWTFLRAQQPVGLNKIPFTTLTEISFSCSAAAKDLWPSTSSHNFPARYFQ